MDQSGNHLKMLKMCGPVSTHQDVVHTHLSMMNCKGSTSNPCYGYFRGAGRTG